jgi:hypothetical protein
MFPTVFSANHRSIKFKLSIIDLERFMKRYHSYQVDLQNAIVFP